MTRQHREDSLGSPVENGTEGSASGNEGKDLSRLGEGTAATAADAVRFRPGDGSAGSSLAPVTRREFLMQTAAASLGAAIPVQVAQAAADGRAEVANAHPQRIAQRITGAAPRLKVIRREETTLRLGDHHGSFHMSWAADDRQFVTLNDGVGWCENSNVLYNSHLFALSGGPQEATFHDVPGYPKKLWLEIVHREGRPARSAYYNGWGILALDGRIYQFLSTMNHDGSVLPDQRFIGAKLIYSPDNGRTWHNQDGSTPVVWEPWERRSRQTLVFFEEPQGAFSLLSILQMGRNYELNRDGYVYVYGPNGSTDSTMNELVMFRVPKTQLLERGAYEYFAELRPDGSAAWTKDITARGVVHTFPRGWVGTTPVPFGWHPSVVYNGPLGLYLMANWGRGWTPDGAFGFGRPSYLGFWVARQPWGPWTQIHEETAWLPTGNPAERAYQPQIVPKWIAADGKSFWLAWPDFQITDPEAFRQFKEERMPITPDDERRWTALYRRVKRYYGFNTQRVDLVLE